MTTQKADMTFASIPYATPGTIFRNPLYVEMYEQ